MQNEEHASGSALEVAKDQNESEKVLGTKWESSSGLDDMMLSMSGKETSTPSTETSTKSNPSVFNFPTAEPVPSQSASVAVTPRVPVPAPIPTPITAIGALSVAGVNIKIEDKGKNDFGDFAFDNDVPMKVIGKLAPRKGVPPKRSTRILSSTADDRFESFESVEKRTSRAIQEAEDHKVAASLQSQENNSGLNGSSRLDAIYKEEAASIYRTAAPAAPAAAAATSSMYGSPKSSGNSYSTSSAPTSTSGSFNGASVEESYQARSKYSSNKGISSDQFFGRDDEDLEIVKNRLAKMGTATAIGSDMLNNDGPADWQGSPSGGGGVGGAVDHRGGRSDSYYAEDERNRRVARVNSSIDQMKDSVTNFLGDIQRRMG